MHDLNTKEISTIADEENDLQTSSFGASASSWVFLPVSSLDSIVEERLRHLLRQKELSEKFRGIDDDTARSEINNFIIEKKREGITKLSVIEISAVLRLPIEQVEKIMDVYKKEGKVKEINE